MLEAILKSGLEELGLSPDEQALGRFRSYYEHLEQTNQVMNLTAIRGEADVARLHFLDCAALLKLYDFAGKRVLDVGSGAGFPGLVLKILRPDMSLCLLDSLDKRIKFLRETGELLGLEELSCIHARAEEAPANFRESYDIVCSRALARLNLLCELCLPYVKPGGSLIAMKGPACHDELEEARNCISLLGGGEPRIVDYPIPQTDIVHSAVIIPKIAPSPGKYPRRWAQIKKQPL